MLLIVARVLRIFVDRRPDSPPELQGTQKAAFVWNHNLLYVVVLLLVTSGVGMLLLSDLGLSPANVTPAGMQK